MMYATSRGTLTCLFQWRNIAVIAVHIRTETKGSRLVVIFDIHFSLFVKQLLEGKRVIFVVYVLLSRNCLLLSKVHNRPICLEDIVQS